MGSIVLGSFKDTSYSLQLRKSQEVACERPHGGGDICGTIFECCQVDGAEGLNIPDGGGRGTFKAPGQNTSVYTRGTIIFEESLEHRAREENNGNMRNKERKSY